MKTNFYRFQIVIICFFLASSHLFLMPVTSSEDTETAEFVIISPDSFIESFQPLITHKIDRGLETRIITIEQIISGDWPIQNVKNGRDDAETIKLFISEAAKQWNCQYVMLVGSKDQLPVRYARITDNSSTISSVAFPHFPLGLPSFVQMMDRYISDLYYADLFFENGSFCSWDSNNNLKFAEKNEIRQIDDVDIYPDIAVGRLLCTSSEEVDIIVEKIITYETNQVDEEWKHRLTVCGGDTHSLWRDILIKLAFSSTPDIKIAWEGEYLGDRAIQIYDPISVNKVYTTGISDEDTMIISQDNINQAINQGCNFLFMAGHGYPEAWGTHPPSVFGKIWLPGPIFDPLLYRSEDVTKLSNEGKLPVAVISACSCGDFNDTDDPIAWTFVEHDSGGAIASFACSTLGTLLPTTLSERTLNGKLALGVFEAYDSGMRRVGDLWRYCIKSYLDDPEAMEFGSFGGAFWLNQFNLEEWILFGDPTLEIY